jgi:hypothetical protein
MRSSLDVLLPIPAFVASAPAMKWDRRNTFCVYSRADERFIISQEVVGPEHIAYSLNRRDALADRGVCSAESDAKEFAKSLISQLSEYLSIHELEVLAAEVQAELAGRAAELSVYHQEKTEPNRP